MWEINSKERKKEESKVDLECIHCKNFFGCKLEKLKGGCLNFIERGDEPRSKDG